MLYLHSRETVQIFLYSIEHVISDFTRVISYNTRVIFSKTKSLSSFSLPFSPSLGPTTPNPLSLLPTPFIPVRLLYSHSSIHIFFFYPSPAQSPQFLPPLNSIHFSSLPTHFISPPSPLPTILNPSQLS